MKIYRTSLSVAALLTISLISLAQRPGWGPQHSLNPGMGFSEKDNGSISGMVADASNTSLKDVRVELIDAHGTIVSGVYTNAAGAFEFSRVAMGSYYVVATAGLQQVRERVDVSSWSASVNLRMPVNKPDDGVTGNSISVAQYRIPSRAREECRKAHDLLEKDKTAEAQVHLEKALSLFPDYAEALTMRAIVSLNEEKIDAAIADLDRAIHADANYAMAYMVMGSALNLKSKFDEALRSLERGESLAPNYWQAHFEMGKAFIGKADYPAALLQLQRARNLAHTEYPLIYLLQAHAYLSMKQYSEAMTALQSYLEKEPNGPNSLQAQQMLQKAQAFMAKSSK